MIEKRVAVALAILLFAAAAAQAQSPVYLVKEINETSRPDGSYPDDFLAFGNLAIFTTNDPYGNPREVWRSDGSETGTFLLGAGGHALAIWNGKIWFTGNDGSLLSSDGTQPAQPVPLPTGVAPYALMPSGPWLYFAAGDYLWRTDGTVGGTAKASGDAVLVLPSAGTAMAGQWAMFTVTGPDANGMPTCSLWRAGTQVEHVKTFPSGTVPRSIGSTGPLVYVDLLTEASNASTLWRTDGTAAGTFALSVMARPYVFSAPYVYFSAAMKLWRTDGSVAGTVPLHASGFESDVPYPLGVLPDGRVIVSGPAVAPPTGGYSGLWSFDGMSSTFLANVSGGVPVSRTIGNVVVAGTAGKLWRTDGSVGGTYKLTDLSGSNLYVRWPMIVIGSGLFFSASDPDRGWELWKTDGTVQNTLLVKDINAATYPSSPTILRALNGGVVFTAIGSGTDTQRDLWFSDGTSAGTRKVLEDVALGDYYGPLTCGRRAYFMHRSDAAGAELWSTDGTALGTALVKDIFPGVSGYEIHSSLPSDFVCVDDRVLFFASSASGRGLWRSDGTAAGTVEVQAGSGGGLTPFGRGVFYTRNYEVWVSDGTPGGTRLVKPIVGSLSSEFVVAGYNAWFTTSDGKLWRTDGTAAGTYPTALPGSPFGLYAFGDRVAIRMGGAAPGYWSTDGGAITRFDPQLSASGSWEFFMRPLNGRLYYNVPQLRSTDGFTSVATGAPDANRQLAVAGGRLYYTKRDLYADRPLLESDGTAGGTQAIFDQPSNEAVASGGRLFIGGNELYAYDMPVTPTTMSPRAVPSSSGGQVVIHGRGFVAPVSVTIDRTPASIVSVTPAAITFTAPPRQAGTYEVKIRTGDGREMTTDERLAYSCSPLTATIGATPPAVCPLVPVQLNGGGGSRCSWFPGTGLDNPSSCTPIATVAETTTYTLIVSDANACTSVNHPTVTVTVKPKPDVVITFSPPPPGGHRPGETYTASVPDGGPGTTYAWTIAGAQLVGPANQRTVTFTTGCDYPLFSVVVSSAQCSVSASVNLGLSDPMEITGISPYRANPGATITVTGTSFQCVTKVRLYDALYNRNTVDIPVTPSSATSVSFRLPANAPPWAYVWMSGPFGYNNNDVNYVLTRPLRDAFTSYDITTDILTRKAPAGVTEERGIHVDGLVASPSQRVDPGPDYTIAAVHEFGQSTPGADVVWQRTSTRELLLQLDRTKPGTVLLRVPAADLAVATTGDLNGNSFAELIMRSTITGATEIWTVTPGSAAVTVQPLHGGGNLNWKIVGSRDFDGDGKHDLLWRDANNGMTLVWFMDGATIRASQIVHQGGNKDWVIAALGDFDADIKTDILWRHTPTGMTLLWRMNGASILQSTAVHPGGNLAWTIIATGDFNGDSKADVLWRDSSPTGAVLRWQMNGAQITKSNILIPALDQAVKIESPRP